MGKNNSKYLLRIKINDFNFLKLTLVNNRDFIFSIPKTNVANQITNTHFTLHTTNERITWKTVSFVKNGRELIKDLLKKVEQSPEHRHMAISTKNELDMLEGKVFGFNNTNNLVDPHIGFSLNLINSSIEKLFINKKTKTPDLSFNKVVNYAVPAIKTGISIKCLIGRNFTGDLGKYLKKCDDYCTISHKNYLGNDYLFLFLVKYVFPEIKTCARAIQM